MFKQGSRSARGLAFSAAAVVALAASPAFAYIGPGAGISMLGALWAVLAGIVLAIAGLLIWPIRALMRRRKAASAADGAHAVRTETTAAEGTGDARS